MIFIGFWTCVAALPPSLLPQLADLFTNRYFRHWLNLVMLYSVWTEFDLIPLVLFHRLGPRTLPPSPHKNSLIDRPF